MQNDAILALGAKFSIPFIAVSDSREKGALDADLGLKFKFDIQDHPKLVSEADLWLAVKLFQTTGIWRPNSTLDTDLVIVDLPRAQ